MTVQCNMLLASRDYSRLLRAKPPVFGRFAKQLSTFSEAAAILTNASWLLADSAPWGDWNIQLPISGVLVLFSEDVEDPSGVESGDLDGDGKLL